MLGIVQLYEQSEVSLGRAIRGGGGGGPRGVVVWVQRGGGRVTRTVAVMGRNSWKVRATGEGEEGGGKGAKGCRHLSIFRRLALSSFARGDNDDDDNAVPSSSSRTARASSPVLPAQ